MRDIGDIEARLQPPVNLRSALPAEAEAFYRAADGVLTFTTPSASIPGRLLLTLTIALQ